ncbi:MAG: thiamine phosphate synthase [Sphingomonas sp.]
MRRRHPPIPRAWLMTDERMGAALWTALARLPRGGGVVFRHYSLPPGERRALFAEIAKVARRRRLVLVRAGAARLRGEMGVHGRATPARGLRTFPRARPARGRRGDSRGRRRAVRLAGLRDALASRRPHARPDAAEAADRGPEGSGDRARR